jgi:hypothetical protein
MAVSFAYRIINDNNNTHANENYRYGQPATLSKETAA